MNNTQALPIIDSHNPNPDSISTAPVIEGGEKRDDWLAHRETFVQELCPVGALETLYAERAAIYLWRLNRVTGCENAAKIGEINARSEKYLEDSQVSRVNRDSPDQPTLQTIIKYEAHLHRCLAGTMAELRRLQKERRQGLRDVNPDGRCADRAGVCQKQQIKDGSLGGSPSHKSSPVQNGSPSQKSSPSQSGSPSQKSSPTRKRSAQPTQSAPKRASPIAMQPPLLETITNRRRLEEYTRGEIFERNLASATLGFAMIPCP